MSSSAEHHPEPSIAPPADRPHAKALACLAAVVLLAQGASLWDGLFFDDYWHRTTLREYGWGFHDLIESATFDLPGRLNNMWWQTQPLRWRYARATAMFFMKLEYLITGASPVGIHLCSLVWHVATAYFVYRLAVWAGSAWRWALLAGSLFILNPHSVFAISWVAARNAQVSAFFFVAALYMYARASIGSTVTLGPLRIGLLALCLALWAVGLFARESAIVFPVVIVVMDWAFGGWRHLLRRIPVHAVVGVVALVYVYWRLMVFPNMDVPSIYFSSPSGLAYVPWALSKLLQMLFATAFYTPMFLGIATYGGFSGEVIGVHAFMVVMVGLVTAWYVWASKHRKDRWIWPVWLVVGYLPVLPVFITPHFSLLPFGAYAIMATVSLSRVPGVWRKIVTVLVILATLWSLGVYRVIWRAIVRSEQLIYEDITYTTDAPPPGSTLFFINLPICAIYAPVPLRDLWGEPDVTGQVLTFAPHPLMMTQPSTVERVGEHELVVSTESPGYFSGLSGQMLLDGMRPGKPLKAGSLVEGELFDTTVLEADEGGITKLKFTFHESLDNPKYFFFVSTPERPAYRLRFGMSDEELAAETKAFRESYAEMLAERAWYFRIAEFSAGVIQSDLYLTSDR